MMAILTPLLSSPHLQMRLLDEGAGRDGELPSHSLQEASRSPPCRIANLIFSQLAMAWGGETRMELWEWREN